MQCYMVGSEARAEEILKLPVEENLEFVRKAELEDR